MLHLLVVDEADARRASMADELCELPGLEVTATASDVPRAFATLDYMQTDVVVAASDLTGASIVTLIDNVRRRGLADIIVMVTNAVLLPGMREYWRDLGACAVVDTMPELVAQLQARALNRQRKREHRLEVATRIENALAASGLATVTTQATAAGDVVSVPVERRPSRTAPLVAVGDVLRNVLPRLARLVHDEVELMLEIAHDVPPVRCNVSDLERLALHMLHDAAAAIPLGGKVWFIVERYGQRHVCIEVLDSSSQSRAPGPNLDNARLIIDRYFGELRIVDLGSATSVQAILPAILDPSN